MARVRSAVPAGMDKWEIEEDLRVCQRYCEVKKDPKRMAAVKKLAAERLQEMAMIAHETRKED
jgi:hypothetical protein